MPDVMIPDKPAFKAGEVCELAQIQPYVLRSWESEFPDLGLSKTPGGPRIYRRVDVERVLRIRDLVFTEGLTVSGVRRRFESEQPAAANDLFSLTVELQAAEVANAIPPSQRMTVLREPDPAAAPAAPVAPAVPDEARARLVQLKQEMRSLLELLDGSGQAPQPGPAPARRPRRA